MTQRGWKNPIQWITCRINHLWLQRGGRGHRHRQQWIMIKNQEGQRGELNLTLTLRKKWKKTWKDQRVTMQGILEANLGWDEASNVKTKLILPILSKIQGSIPVFQEAYPISPRTYTHWAYHPHGISKRHPTPHHFNSSYDFIFTTSWLCLCGHKCKPKFTNACLHFNIKKQTYINFTLVYMNPTYMIEIIVLNLNVNHCCSFLHELGPIGWCPFYKQEVWMMTTSSFCNQDLSYINEP